MVVKALPSCVSAAAIKFNSSSSNTMDNDTAKVFSAVVNASGSHPFIRITQVQSMRLPPVSCGFSGYSGKTFSLLPPSHSASSTWRSS